MPAPQSYVTLTLPHSLARLSSIASPYQDYYNIFDYAIGGVPFKANIGPDSPLTRGSAQFRKDQFDSGTEPGEQSLTGWWLRSQSSWHLGTGIVNSDVRLDDTAEFRFADSEGINPWSPGEITLQHITESVASGGNLVSCLGVSINGVDSVLYSTDTDLYKVDADGVATAITWGGSGSIQSIASDGESWYASSADGVYSGALTGTTGSKLWTLSATRCVVRWLKNRIMASVDNALYELVPPVGASPHALPGSPTYTHPVDDFWWTDLADGPEAIYAVGFHGTDSSILKLTLSTTGAVPTLTAATTAAELPRNEVGYSLYSYLGAYMMLGTNRGMRVAIIAAGGNLEYGPLIETPGPVMDFVAQDHFVWAGYSNGFTDGLSGAIRIDLAAPLSNGRYPYARDLRVDSSGEVMGLTTLGTSDRVVMAVADAGLFYESADTYEPNGWFTTGRIRYNTLWPKLYRQFNIKADLRGPIAIASIDTDGNEFQIASVSTDNQQDSDLLIGYPAGPQEYISLRFTLSRNPLDATSTPVFRGYQIKALPAGPRPRQYVIPLSCYDYEMTEAGQRLGFTGFCLERLEALEAMDSAGDVVPFEDLKAGRSVPVTIEQLEFRQMVPPQPNGSRWGGVLTVVLRTVS